MHNVGSAVGARHDLEISGRCRDQLRAISCLLRDRPSPPLAPASPRRSRLRISSVEAVSAVRAESQPWHARSRAAPRSDSQRTGTLRKATSQRQARRIRIWALKRENGTFGRKSMSLAWLHSVDSYPTGLGPIAHALLRNRKVSPEIYYLGPGSPTAIGQSQAPHLFNEAKTSAQSST